MYKNTLESVSGNTIGNILNSGYAVEDNHNIYFIAPDSELVNVCIYKADKKGENIETIYSTEDTLISINSVGGDLYFLSLLRIFVYYHRLCNNKHLCRH